MSAPPQLNVEDTTDFSSEGRPESWERCKLAEPAAATPHPSISASRRILVIDDNREIHDDFRKILTPDDAVEFSKTCASMFGETAPDLDEGFEIDCASQGEEGVELVRRAERQGRPYATAFVDMLMPPGIDGIETALKLWGISPDLQVVICTAHSQTSWPEALARLGHSDRLLILKKPFDPIEVQQLAHALTAKWRLSQAARVRLNDLEARVGERTRALTTANEKLREQAALLDKAQEAIIVWNLDDTVRFWNKSAERLYGRTPEEIVGKPVAPLFHHAAAQFQAARRSTVEGGSWQGELPHARSDGQTLCIEGHWTLVRDDFGVPQSILAIHTDITEKKELAAHFFRTQRLESIGTLAGGIAHDLNNVLTPIMMSVGMLKMNSHGGEDLELLESIGTSAARGAEMVRQVLSFARGAGGERRLTQPQQLIDDVQKIARDTFPKNIRGLSTVCDDLWHVQGDPTQLHQVLLNLYVNARDAMPAGGEFSVSAENVTLDEYYVAMNPEAKPGPYVVIALRDRGTGIPAKLLEKIFDPFFTTKPQGQGTGLGLSTSLGIVKSHGGFIRVNSEVGKGTTFRVYLPAETGPRPARTEEREAPVPRGQGEWILVVDDEAPIRKLTIQILEGSGYRTFSAADGVEAVALFAKERKRIAAVISDVTMPVMDGGAMIQVLTRMEPKVKVIAVSGLSAASLNPTIANRIQKFLPKPYTTETLLRTVAAVLGQEVSAS
jgi:PAS domain S-box-containing protein